MFERTQKPFLTVDTGEAYQPIRLSYTVHDRKALLQTLNQLACLKKRHHSDSWEWFWSNECEELRFDSHDHYKKNAEHPPRLGALLLEKNTLRLTLSSFKRACLAVSFFHRLLSPSIATIHHADFINKVFAVDERIAHNFTENFKESELERTVKQRANDYEKILHHCEEAHTAEDALIILADYAKRESHKKLAYAERYEFQQDSNEADPDVLYLGFYVFLRSRELVAIRRFQGEAQYTIADVAEESMGEVFGDMDIDLLE